MAGSAASGQEYDSVFDSYEGSTACSSLQLQVPTSHARRCYDDLGIAAPQSLVLAGDKWHNYGSAVSGSQQPSATEAPRQ